MGTLSTRSSSQRSNSLHGIFQTIAAARNQRELRLRFVDIIGNYFGVQRWGIHLFDDQLKGTQSDTYGVSVGFGPISSPPNRAFDIAASAFCHCQVVWNPPDSV